MKIILRNNYHGACYDIDHCDQFYDKEIVVDGKVTDLGYGGDVNYNGIVINSDDLESWNKLFNALGLKVELEIDDNYDRQD